MQVVPATPNDLPEMVQLLKKSSKAEQSKI